jgi:phosphatidylglycerol:prolipoprotein diacylglycerol transferase
MWQVLFHIPIIGIPIYGYGLMLLIGLLCAMTVAQYLARRVGIDPELFVNAALIALVFGVAGARLSDVLENLSEFTKPNLSIWQNFFNMINIRSGGLTYYGGFMLATPALIAYAMIKRIPLRIGMDICAPCLMIGLGFGRIGCYLNGCCYGARNNGPVAQMLGTFPYRSNAYMDQIEEGQLRIPPELLGSNGWPMSVDDIKHLPDLTDAERAALVKEAQTQHALPVYPAELFSTLTAWLIAAWLLAYFTLPHAPGRVFALMMIAEGISRYLLEMVRAEPPVNLHLFGPMSLSMVLAIPIALTGIVLWFAFGAYARKEDSLPAIWAPA